MADTSPRIILRTVPLTEATLVGLQLGDIFEYMRAQRDGDNFLPSQFGGLYGQRELLREKSVVSMTGFRPREY